MVPTAEQETARWLESPVGQRAAEARANRANRNGYRAMFDGLPTAQIAEFGTPAAAAGARLFGDAAVAPATGGTVEQ